MAKPTPQSWFSVGAKHATVAPEKAAFTAYLHDRKAQDYSGLADYQDMCTLHLSVVMDAAPKDAQIGDKDGVHVEGASDSTKLGTSVVMPTSEAGKGKGDMFLISRFFLGDITTTPGQGMTRTIGIQIIMFATRLGMLKGVHYPENTVFSFFRLQMNALQYFIANTVAESGGKRKLAKQLQKFYSGKIAVVSNATMILNDPTGQKMRSLGVYGFVLNIIQGLEEFGYDSNGILQLRNQFPEMLLEFHKANTSLRAGTNDLRVMGRVDEVLFLKASPNYPFAVVIAKVFDAADKEVEVDWSKTPPTLKSDGTTDVSNYKCEVILTMSKMMPGAGYFSDSAFADYASAFEIAMREQMSAEEKTHDAKLLAAKTADERAAVAADPPYKMNIPKVLEVQHNNNSQNRAKVFGAKGKNPGLISFLVDYCIQCSHYDRASDLRNFGAMLKDIAHNPAEGNVKAAGVNKADWVAFDTMLSAAPSPDKSLGGSYADALKKSSGSNATLIALFSSSNVSQQMLVWRRMSGALGPTSDGSLFKTKGVTVPTSDPPVPTVAFT